MEPGRFEPPSRSNLNLVTGSHFASLQQLTRPVITMFAEGSSPPPETEDFSAQLPLSIPVVNYPSNGLPPQGRKRKRAPPVAASSPAPSDPGSASGNNNPTESAIFPDTYTSMN